MEIIKPFTKRCGFETGGMKLLGHVLSPFFQCKCQLPPELSHHQEAIVFVCNHYEVFGPVAVALSLPLRYRFWINALVLEATQNIDYMIVGTKHALPFLSEKAVRKLLESFTPVIERVLKRFRSLPVYHTHLGRQRRSIEQTVDAMLEGDHIVLFPETAVPAYSHGRVTAFYRSFALIGEVYRRRTGRSAAFCPLYVDKKHRKLCFGQLVHYGAGQASVECEKLVQELRAQLLAMADAALGSCTDEEVCVQ